MSRNAWCGVAVSLILFACGWSQIAAMQPSSTSSRQPEAYSLFGKPLYPVEPAGAQKVRLESDLAQATAEYETSPGDPERVIWLGRRLAYLARYREAIDVYSKGIEAHPSNAKLYRHRGHRYITIRQFDRAIADFEKAASLIKGQKDEIEPDGAPNKYNKPRSTLQSNIWYHLALAQYLKGELQTALGSYLECMKVSTVNDDMLVATSDWLYMTYRRLGRVEEAKKVLEPIRENMEILENTAYHRRLLMYKGLLPPEALLDTEGADSLQIATQGYGVGNWYLYNGRTAKAEEIFKKILQGELWAAFGYIAAEADLKRGLR